MSLPTVPPAVRRGLAVAPPASAGPSSCSPCCWHFGTGPFAEAWQVTTWPAVLAALVADRWRAR